MSTSDALAVAALAHYGGSGSGGGVDHILGFIAHAVIWQAVGRVIRHAPPAFVVVAFAGAVLYLLWNHHRRRSPRGGEPRSRGSNRRQPPGARERGREFMDPGPKGRGRIVHRYDQ